MDVVFNAWQDIPFTENYIKQLHQILLQHSDKDAWHRGQYKTNTNSVAAFDEHGQQIGIVFQTSSPFDTPRLMGELVSWVNAQRESKLLHPLLVTAIFVVVFLEIHPFQDGNGRISLPPSHRNAVGIEKKAVLLGMGDKFELWSEQAHHEQIRQTLGDADLGDDLQDLVL